MATSTTHAPTNPDGSRRCSQLYKILDSAPSTPLPRRLPLSPLDAKDGFIHLSTAAQVPRTAALFFASTERLWILKVPLGRLQRDPRPAEAGDGSKSHEEVESSTGEEVGETERKSEWRGVLKWDPVRDGDGDQVIHFPHLYGEGLGVDEVERVLDFTRQEGQRWEDVLNGLEC